MASRVRDHSHMTSALRGREGGCPKHDDSTDRLREWDSDKGGVVQKAEKFVDIISMAPYINKYKCNGVSRKIA